MSDPHVVPILEGETGCEVEGAAKPPIRRRRAALGFIFVTALMDIMAIGIVIPVLPKLVEHFTHGDAAKAAGYVGAYGAVWALMQFIFSPVQGALSDHFGRRPVLLVSLFGLGADYVLMALAPNVGWLFIGRTISGITAASFSTANAYIADITPPENRAASFGMMGAAFGVGFIIGPSLGGVLGQIDPRLPFWAAAGLAFANGVYGLLILPESLPQSRRAPFKLANASPLGSLRLLGETSGLRPLALVMFFYFLAFQVFQSTFVLYAGYRYGWTTQTVGLCLGATGLCNIAVQSGLVKPIVRKTGERGALYVGLAFAAAGMAIYGLAPNGFWFWFGVPIYSMVGLVQPGAQGMMTRRIRPDQQGRLQGTLSSIMAMAGLGGPLLFTQVFAHAITGPKATTHPGAPFILSASLLICALVTAAATRRASAPSSAAPV